MLQLFQVKNPVIMTINGSPIKNLLAIYHLALGLERWFPNNNSAFAYGTRLCEETGELVEALTETIDGGLNEESKNHLTKEIEDVLQIIVGVLGIYHLNDRLPSTLAEFMDNTSRKATKIDIITVSIYAGRFADAINHQENQGIKKQKHGHNSDERLLESARLFIKQIMIFVQQHDLMNDLEKQIEKDYLALAKKGLIELPA